jgi:hypothetical protein
MRPPGLRMRHASTSGLTVVELVPDGRVERQIDPVVGEGRVRGLALHEDDR